MKSTRNDDNCSKINFPGLFINKYNNAVVLAEDKTLYVVIDKGNSLFKVGKFIKGSAHDFNRAYSPYYGSITLSND